MPLFPLDIAEVLPRHGKTLYSLVMPLKQTPDIARLYLLCAALMLAMPSALSLYSRYQGRVLVALPRMENIPLLVMYLDRRGKWPSMGVALGKAKPYFFHTLVYMDRHDGWGSVGLILNRPLPEEEMDKLPPEKQGFDWRVGGPVGFPDRVSVLVPEEGNNTGKPLRMMSLYEYTQTYPEKWQSVLSDPQKKRSFAIYLGITGWGPLQLDREYWLGAWSNTEFSTFMIHQDTVPEESWRRAMREIMKKSPPAN